MVKLDIITTRGGDTGETSLGDGTRVRKDTLRIEAMGAVDEANAALGLLRLHTAGTPEDAMLARHVVRGRRERRARRTPQRPLGPAAGHHEHLVRVARRDALDLRSARAGQPEVVEPRGERIGIDEVGSAHGRGS